MTIEEIQKERGYTERRIEAAIREFMARTGVRDWQITVQWGEVSISTVQGDHGRPAGHMATLIVRV